MTYYKTIITTTILSKGFYTFHDLRQVHNDMSEGDVSGEFIKSNHWLSMEDMAVELDGQGSDPAFLLDEDYMDILDDRQAARDNFHNTYHYTCHMSQGIYTLQIEIEEPIPIKISITGSRDKLDILIERYDSPNLITYTGRVQDLISPKYKDLVFRDNHNDAVEWKSVEDYCSSLDEALSLLGVYPEDSIASLIISITDRVLYP